MRTFDRLGLDRKGIIGVTMPGFGTSNRTYRNSIALMRCLGITSREISIRKACEHGQVNEAVIVGGGFIGLEAAVALSDMWGVKVSVVEMMDQMLPGVLSHNMGKMAAHDCEAHGLSVYTSEKVVKLEGKDGAVCKVITDKRELPAQLVIFAAGFLPNGQLAKDAGLTVDMEGFKECFKKHQATSQAGAEQRFKGGLADHSAQSARLHTATHLLVQPQQ